MVVKYLKFEDGTILVADFKSQKDLVNLKVGDLCTITSNGEVVKEVRLVQIADSKEELEG